MSQQDMYRMMAPVFNQFMQDFVNKSRSASPMPQTQSPSPYPYQRQRSNSPMMGYS